ncbi:manganese efflux pump MntP family protein [Calditrichota bacterium]
MNNLEIIIIAIGLAMDAFAVSLGVSASRGNMSIRPTFRLSFHFGLFQFMMPVIGWIIGYEIVDYLKFTDWIAFGLLAFVGVRMIIAGIKNNPTQRKKDQTKGLSLVILSVATSIDALAIGFSLAMLNLDIWYPSVIIGLITAMLSLIAIYLGKKMKSKFGNHMEIIGGLILLVIGFKIILF